MCFPTLFFKCCLPALMKNEPDLQSNKQQTCKSGTECICVYIVPNENTTCKPTN